MKTSLELFVFRKDMPDAVLSPQTVNVFINASDFSENTVTWNNAPALNPTTHSVNVTDSDVGSFISIDITDLVIGWFNGSIPNNGITLAGIENLVDTIIGYFSSKWMVTSQSPFLNIEYGTLVPELFFNEIAGGIIVYPPLNTEVSVVSVPVSATAGENIKIDYALEVEFTIFPISNLILETRLYRDTTLITTRILERQTLPLIPGQPNQRFDIANTYVDTAIATGTTTYDVRVIVTQNNGVISGTAYNRNINCIAF